MRPSDPPPSLPPAVLAALACFVLTLLILLPRLGEAPLAGTEGHRAVTAHQMLASNDVGDWLVPKLYGRTYLRKPPGFYWILAGVEAVTGRANEWVWRLPSVVSAGFLASVLALFGGRWFGRIGAWASGLSYAALVALWPQSRTADIDAVNTLVTITCALAIVELHFGNPLRRAPWMVLIGITFGASLLLKFHAGLPVIVGVILCSMLASRYTRDWLWLRRPWSLGGLTIGICIALVWVGLALFHGLMNDTSGLREAVEKALPVTLAHPDAGGSEPPVLKRLLKALLVPPQLFLFAMPFSLAVPMALNRHVRRPMEPGARRLIVALAVSLLASWAVCLLAGMTNARYGNITLPLVCPIVGALAANVSRCGALQKSQLRLILTVVAGALLAAQPALLAAAWHSTEGRAPLLAAALVGVGGALIGIHLFARRSFVGTIALLASIYALSIPLGVKAVEARFARSGFLPARHLRETIGPDEPVVMGAMLRFQPELFHYAALNARAYGEDIPDVQRLPAILPSGGWLVLNDAERAVFRARIPTHLPREIPFTSNNKRCWIVRYQP